MKGVCLVPNQLYSNGKHVLSSIPGGTFVLLLISSMREFIHVERLS